MVTNYSVSVLPVFSKFLERIVYNRLIEFLNKYNILSNNQYGFRKQHSTGYALMQLYDKISDALDQRKVTVRLFIDLSKACGVPQCSILGPLHFLLYINDLCKVSTVLDMIFADTNIVYSHKDPDYLMETMYSELKKLTNSFQANKVSINVKKSNFVIFKPRQKGQTLDLTFTISNRTIKRVDEVVFLGVILDEHLSWKSHIHNVTRKVSKAIGIIYKSSFCLNKTSLHTLY